MQSATGKRPVMPILDVITRWNSLHEHIQRAIDVQYGIDHMAEDLEGVEELSKEEWKILKMIRDFLDPFKAVSTAMGGFKYPTIGLTVPLYNLLLEHTESWANDTKKSAEMRQSATRAKEKIEKYYEKCTDVYLVATVLDPRMKIEYFRKSDLFYDVFGKDLVTEKFYPA